ncbi:hypothetical protein AAC387_Pa06g1237 [Persea americana]
MTTGRDVGEFTRTRLPSSVRSSDEMTTGRASRKLRRDRERGESGSLEMGIGWKGGRMKGETKREVV